MKLSDVETLLNHIRRRPVRTLFYSFAAAVIAIAGVWFEGYFGEVGSHWAKKPELKIVDLTVVKPKSPSPVVDLKLLNSGEGTAYVTQVSAEVLRRVPYAGLVEPSANYDVLIDSDINTVTVSHEIKSNGVERLQLTLGANRYNMSCYFELQLRLTYNGGQTVLSQPFEVSFVEES